MSNRNIVVDRLRALAMLGVIGIHIGPFVFASSTPRLDLFLLFQVFTRFAVPSFFFISGFGLFCNDALHRPFHYFNFIKKHLITVGLPYFVWSFFYIAMWQWEDMYRPDRSFSVSVLIVKFLLGEGCYHIYFMVILLYFYFSMPFWRWLVRWISEKSAAGIAASLSVLAALQILLYQWSATYWNYPPWTQGHAMIIRLLNERMNYLPLFYGFIFVLGGVCAIHEKKLRRWLQCHFTSSLGVFLLSCAVLVWKFKQYVLAGIPLEDIPAKFMTQLTPEGLLYTVCWLLFFSAALQTFVFGCALRILYDYLPDPSPVPVLLAAVVPAVGLFHCADTGVGILHFSISDFAVGRYGNSQTGKKIPAHRFSTVRQAAAIIF